MRELSALGDGLALAIGLGIVPLDRGPGLARAAEGRAAATGGRRAFTIVTVATIVCFGMYTAVKAAYISTRVRDPHARAEPDLPRAAAVRRHGAVPPAPPGALVGGARGGAFALYLVHITPYSLTQYPNYEAHGLAIIALANRIFIWPASTIEHALITVTVVVDAPARARSPRSARRGSAVLATVADRRRSRSPGR